jgi:hypothetical protein
VHTCSLPQTKTHHPQAAKNEHLLARDMAKLADRLQARVEELEVRGQCGPITGGWVQRAERRAGLFFPFSPDSCCANNPSWLKHQSHISSCSELFGPCCATATSSSQVELQRWVDHHEAIAAATRAEIVAEYETAASEAARAAASEADVLRRRGDDAFAALEAARDEAAAAAAEVAALRCALAEARAEAAAAREAEATKRAAAEEDIAALQAEATQLREELARAQEAAARDAELAARERVAITEAHAAELARLEARQAEGVAAAAAAAAAAATAHERALGETEARVAARLREQAASLAARHAEQVAAVTSAAASSARAAAEAHAAEVEQLQAELAAARSFVADAERRAAAAEVAAARASTDARRWLEVGEEEHEATRRELRALRRDSIVRRASLLRAKAVVQEVREDPQGGTSTSDSSLDCWSSGGSGSGSAEESGGEGAMDGDAKAGGSGARSARRRARRLERMRVARAAMASPLSDDGWSEPDGGLSRRASRAADRVGDPVRDGAAAPTTEPDAGPDAAPESEDQTRGRFASATLTASVPPAARPGRPPAGDLLPSDIMSPVRWLRQAVRSPDSIRTQTPAEKARMLRHVISQMQWEAAGIMNEPVSSGRRSGSASSASARASRDSSEGVMAAGDDIEGQARHTAASRRLFGSGDEERSAETGGTEAAAEAGVAAGAAQPVRRRRQLAPLQLQLERGRQPAASAREQSASSTTAAARGAATPAAAAPSGACWPEAYAREPSPERRAALDAVVLKDLRARRRRAVAAAAAHAAQGQGTEEGGLAKGVGPQGPEPVRVTVELLVAALQGHELGGTEWRRGAKKRHHLVADYLAWAAANPLSGDLGANGAARGAAAGGGGGGEGEGEAAEEGGAGAEGAEDTLLAAYFIRLEEKRRRREVQRRREQEGAAAARAPAAVRAAAPAPAAVASALGDKDVSRGVAAAVAALPGFEQQHHQQQPQSPAMALLQEYADTPPATKLLTAARQVKGGLGRSHGAGGDCGPGACMRGDTLAAAAAEPSCHNVTLEDIFAAGSRRFCESQLPIRRR